jgi:hypothetical protein
MLPTFKAQSCFSQSGQIDDFTLGGYIPRGRFTAGHSYRLCSLPSAPSSIGP